jgi:hypothetical protein
MSTAPTTRTDRHAVLNGAGETVETGSSHHEALQIADWYGRHESAAGPYRVVPVIPPQRTGS